jgi:hypothetical protein
MVPPLARTVGGCGSPCPSPDRCRPVPAARRPPPGTSPTPHPVAGPARQPVRPRSRSPTAPLVPVPPARAPGFVSDSGRRPFDRCRRSYAACKGRHRLADRRGHARAARHASSHGRLDDDRDVPGTCPVPGAVACTGTGLTTSRPSDRHSPATAAHRHDAHAAQRSRAVCEPPRVQWRLVAAGWSSVRPAIER